MDASTLATAAGSGAPDAAGAGVSWWQAIGGTVAVFALLLLALRFLARWQGAARSGAAAILAVLPLGPRREIQVLRVREQVHYVYRQDGALVLLGSEALAAYEAAGPLAPRAGAGPLGAWASRLIGRASPSPEGDGARGGRSLRP